MFARSQLWVPWLLLAAACAPGGTVCGPGKHPDLRTPAAIEACVCLDDYQSDSGSPLDPRHIHYHE